MDKLLEFLGKILEAIFSPKVLWLIVVAVAILAWAMVIISGTTSGILVGTSALLEQLNAWALFIALAATALILAKVVTWIAQSEKLIEILTKIVQSVLTAETFWLIVVALAVLGLVLRIPGSTLKPSLDLIPVAAMALIIAKVVVWAVDRVVEQYFA